MCNNLHFSKKLEQIKSEILYNANVACTKMQTHDTNDFYEIII